MSEQVMNTVVSIRVPADIRDRLNDNLRKTKQSISDFMRDRICEYLNSNFTIPGPKTESLQVTCGRDLERVRQLQAFLKRRMEDQYKMPRPPGIYSFSREDAERQDQYTPDRDVVRELFKIIDEVNEVSETLCDIAISRTKGLMAHDRRLQCLLSNLHEAVESQKTIDFRDIFDRPPYPDSKEIRLLQMLDGKAND